MSTPEERHFKRAVEQLVSENSYPSPETVRRRLKLLGSYGSDTTHTGLNSQEHIWRSEKLEEMGWTWTGGRGRAWDAPEGWIEIKVVVG